MNNFKVMMNGIIKENPTFVLLLGMCPTLGTTSSAINGMGMGLATIHSADCCKLYRIGTCRGICCQKQSGGFLVRRSGHGLGLYHCTDITGCRA